MYAQWRVRLIAFRCLCVRVCVCVRLTPLAQTGKIKSAWPTGQHENKVTAVKGKCWASWEIDGPLFLPSRYCHQELNQSGFLHGLGGGGAVGGFRAAHAVRDPSGPFWGQRLPSPGVVWTPAHLQSLSGSLCHFHWVCFQTFARVRIPPSCRRRSHFVKKNK